MPIGILWPTFALVAVIFAVWLTLVVQRFGHMRRTPPRRADFATTEATNRYFAPVELAGNNLRNLFEMPVLYFALVPLLLVTRHGDHAQVILAWVFVILRAVHSVVHIGPKNLRVRFLLYVASCAVLLAMWIGFAVDMIAAGLAYDAAMARLAG